MALYRRTRAEAQRLLGEARAAGYGAVAVAGEGEIAEICRLTCLEQGMAAAGPGGNLHTDSGLPLLRVVGRDLALEWPDAD